MTYPGYHELAYLHPDRFTPDADHVHAAGLEPENYFILRFVSWQASHDLGETGLAYLFKHQLVKKLEKHGRVLITSESPLPADLESYRFSFPPDQMHHLLAHAKMLVGESATMASEAAVLGVPALFISNTGRGYTDELEKRYGLVFNFTRSQTNPIMQKMDDLLSIPDLRALSQQRRSKLLREKIDTTQWMLNYIDSVGRTPFGASRVGNRPAIYSGRHAL